MSPAAGADRAPLRVMAAFYFLMFALPVGIHAYRPVLRFPVPGPDFWRVVAVDCAFGLLAAAALSAVSALLVRFSALCDGIARGLWRAVGPLGGENAFFLAAFSALGEEFLFRGLLQPWLGILPASICFGLVHVGPDRKYWAWTAYAFSVGLSLGLLYDWRANLLLPVVVHFAVNFASLCWMEKRYGREVGAGSQAG